MIAKTVLDLENGAMERWRKGDPLGWLEISAPEIVYIDPELARPVVGLEEYRRLLEPLKGKIAYDASDFIDPRVAVHGDLAVLTYNYRDVTRNPDQTLKYGVRWNTTEVYARIENRWKIIHTHWSYVGHKPPKKLEIPLPIAFETPAYPGALGELMALESAAMERWRKGDPGGFIDISAPGVTYFGSNTPARLDGLEALKAEYQKVEGQVRFEAMDFIAPRVQVHGNAAVLTYRFLSTRLRPDGSVDRRTPWNCTEVYAKVDGRWRIVHTHWSLIFGTT
jgi:ketosteroid isomerase-like protein